MPNHLKFCSCRSCRAGRHRGDRKGRLARAVTRRLRYGAKAALKRGLEPERVLSVGRTD